jgi:hypothetical protein
VTTVATLLTGCVAHDLRGIGFSATATNGITHRECEAYNCNQSNTASIGAFTSSIVAVYDRCVAHDNSGGNTAGFFGPNGGSTYIDCIADTNGGAGFSGSISLGNYNYVNCDAYNNGSSGVALTSASNPGNVVAVNCNFVKNGAYGVNLSGAVRHGMLVNCGFGAGTQANTSGTTNGLSGVVESGSVTYASDVTPWVDPANGNFSISLAAAKGAGRGTFTETAASYSGTVAYPDIGAGQSNAAAGGGGSGSSTRLRYRPV